MSCAIELIPEVSQNGCTKQGAFMDKTRSRLALGLIAILEISSIGFSAYAQDTDRIATIRKGIQFHDQGNYQTALAIYQSLLADDPKDDLVLYEAALTYSAMQEYPACIEHAERAAAVKSQTQAAAITILASCQDDAGQLDKALKTFAKGVKSYPQDVPLNFNYGISLQRDGDLRRAAKHLQVAMERAPKYASPYLPYADIRQAQGSTAIATLLYLRFIMLEPQSDRAVDAAKNAVRPFLPSDENTINLNVDALEGRGGEAIIGLELMLGIARNAKIEHESDEASAAGSVLDGDRAGKDTEADKVVNAMQTFFLLAQAMEAKSTKALSKDFGWITSMPLWDVLGKQDVLTVYCYHVADLASIDGARQWLSANPERINKLREVLVAWHGSLGR
jgi:tetratricopeptide (TPR) repeat protein